MADRPQDIRIDDLADPQLTPMQQAVIEGAAGIALDWTEEAILGAAREQVLDDGGQGGAVRAQGTALEAVAAGHHGGAVIAERAAAEHDVSRCHLVVAELALGRLAREDGRLEESARILLDAEQEAMDQGYVDEAFEAYYELHLVSKEAGDGKHEYYLKRCRRYYPLVQAKTPQVLAYEKLVRSQA